MCVIFCQRIRSIICKNFQQQRLSRRFCTEKYYEIIEPVPYKQSYGLASAFAAIVPGIIFGALGTKTLATYLQDNNFLHFMDDDDDD